MFLIITHIYLHPIYNEPLIQLSTAGSPSPSHQVMQITNDTNRWKDYIIYMQILKIPVSKKTIRDWLNHNFCSYMTEITLKCDQ